MNLTNLLEALKDIPTQNQLFHRTNYMGLKLMLKDGFIEGYEYDIDGEKSVAAGRKAIFSKIDKGVIPKENLSDNIGKVQIILYKDRIKGSHLTRGIKKASPEAELPRVGDKILNRELAGTLFKKKFEDLSPQELSRLKKFIALTERLGRDITNELVDTMVKSKKQRASIINTERLMNKEKKLDVLYDKFINVGKETTKSLVREILRNKAERDHIKTFGKEHEERFSSKKTKANIPINPLLMKIELLPGFTEEEADHKDQKSVDGLKELIKKYDKVFIHNRELHKLMNS